MDENVEYVTVITFTVLGLGCLCSCLCYQCITEIKRIRARRASRMSEEIIYNIT